MAQRCTSARSACSEGAPASGASPSALVASAAKACSKYKVIWSDPAQRLKDTQRRVQRQIEHVIPLIDLPENVMEARLVSLNKDYEKAGAPLGAKEAGPISLNNDYEKIGVPYRVYRTDKGIEIRNESATNKPIICTVIPAE